MEEGYLLTLLVFNSVSTLVIFVDRAISSWVLVSLKCRNSYVIYYMMRIDNMIKIIFFEGLKPRNKNFFE